MEFKKGDRVRVCCMEDSCIDLIRGFGGRSPIGNVGTVEEVSYNRNMAVYGKEKEIHVHMDGTASNVTEIWYEENLELI